MLKMYYYCFIKAFNNSAKSILENLEKNKVNSDEVKGVDLKKRKAEKSGENSKCC